MKSRNLLWRKFIKDNKRVVITGIGCLSSLGLGKNNNWEGLINHKINPQKIAEEEPLKKIYYAHKAENFDIKNFIDKKLIKDLENWKEGERVIDLEYLILAVKLALEDSRLSYDKEENRIGIIAMHENPGIDQFVLKISNELFEFFRKKSKLTKQSLFEENIFKFNKSIFELQTFMLLHHLAKIFSFRGYSLFINNACASGLYGIEAASQAIKSNKCPAAIVVAADTVDIFKQLWFEKLGMHSKSNRTKPFSRKADGFVLGEGAAALVLEDFEFAKKRGAFIYGEYLGGSYFLEGWKITIPAVWSNFYERTIRESLKMSNIKEKKVDIFSPHGIGVPVVDRYEARTIRKIFGQRESQPLITPFKPYIGHTLGVNTLLETIFLLLCLNNNFVPSVYNYEGLVSDLNIPKTDTHTSLGIGVKTCCGFGGYLGCCVFKKI
jgi:3-oxoacyl-(acyl-carrier-protein) synthase